MGRDDEEKGMKGDEGENQQGNRRQDSRNRSKENNEKKPDYIHVRARRGQATDSHSLAERVSIILFILYFSYIYIYTHTRENRKFTVTSRPLKWFNTIITH